MRPLTELKADWPYATRTMETELAYEIIERLDVLLERTKDLKPYALLVSESDIPNYLKIDGQWSLGRDVSDEETPECK